MAGGTRHRRDVRAPIDRVLLPFQEFAAAEASGAVLLLACTAVALVWANSPWAASYFHLWEVELVIEAGAFRLAQDLHHWINDGLMVLFFFVVGLEIKREVLVGELASFRRAAFPILAAVGGIVVPVALYLAINGGTDAARGWGVPMATDIAFALGILALVRGPTALKVFLASLAIADDIAAVLAIAAFYTTGIVWEALLVGGLFLLVLVVTNLAGVRSPIVYALLGLGLWYCFLVSGVHPTTGGVLVAMTIPARSRIDAPEFLERARTFLGRFEASSAEAATLIEPEQADAAHGLERALEEVQTPLQRLEHALLPWVSYLVVPLFALANAGVSLEGGAGDLLHPVSLGIILGLVVGKQIGVTAFAWLAVRLGIAAKPPGITWRQVYGVGWLAGIGFTMSLFIANLAFGGDPLLDVTKVGVLAASAVAGTVGFLLLRPTGRPPAGGSVGPGAHPGGAAGAGAGADGAPGRHAAG